jgi:RHS repeat-associated protein
MLAGAKDELYGVDTLNRLTSFDRGDLNANKDGLTGAAVKYQDWTLDKVGNWPYFYDDSATAQTRLHNAANEITAIDSSSANLGYDPAGNMTRAPKAAGYYRYEYDHLNRVTAVTNDQGTPVAEYAYDALNRRIEKVDKTGQSNVTYTYYYTPGWQLLEVYKDGDADVYERYLWGGQYIDELIRRERDSTTDGSFDETHFSSQDGNWNVTALINTDGTVAERYLYDAYGTPTVLDADWSVDGDGISDVANPILYAGYFFDSETASFHVRNRYLHTGLGRWISRDLAEYVDGMNLYGYVRSRPQRDTDPLGKWGSDIHYDGTQGSAVAVGMSSVCASKIAAGDQGVDD